MTLTTAAFAPDGPIPVKYTCDGADLSPALRWGAPPDGTRSFALIADDPDAPGGTWVHWVLYNVPPEARALDEGVPPKPTLTSGARQGVNDFRNVGYGGPCPPQGSVHRYAFTLYALDAALALPPKATKAALERAMQGHVLAHCTLVGRYRRA